MCILFHAVRCSLTEIQEKEYLIQHFLLLQSQLEAVVRTEESPARLMRSQPHVECCDVWPTKYSWRGAWKQTERFTCFTVWEGKSEHYLLQCVGISTLSAAFNSQNKTLLGQKSHLRGWCDYSLMLSAAMSDPLNTVQGSLKTERKDYLLHCMGRKEVTKCVQEWSNPHVPFYAIVSRRSCKNRRVTCKAYVIRVPCWGLRCLTH